MKNKIICILVCMLLLSLTLSMTSAQKITKENEKDENQATTVIDNSPPTDPIITAPDTVRKNMVFIAGIVSTDPEEDQIYYRVNVGEEDNPSNWGGPYESGIEFKTGVGIFQVEGEITFSWQAKDEHGAESGWSHHTITFTKSRSKPITSTFIDILQNYPRLLQLLRLILIS
jgi:hypothetical protein